MTHLSAQMETSKNPYKKTILAKEVIDALQNREISPDSIFKITLEVSDPEAFNALSDIKIGNLQTLSQLPNGNILQSAIAPLTSLWKLDQSQFVIQYQVEEPIHLCRYKTEKRTLKYQPTLFKPEPSFIDTLENLKRINAADLIFALYAGSTEDHVLMSLRVKDIKIAKNCQELTFIREGSGFSHYPDGSCSITARVALSNLQKLDVDSNILEGEVSAPPNFLLNQDSQNERPRLSPTS